MPSEVIGTGAWPTSTSSQSIQSAGALVDTPDCAQHRFSGLIEKGATCWGGPRFNPHATLIAGVMAGCADSEVADKTRALAESIRPFHATVESVGCKDLFFQSVFAVLQKDPELLEANQKAREVFGCEDQDPYFPHISLFYGDIPMDQRAEIKKEMEPDIAGFSFPFDSIELWSTEGEIKDWYKVESFPLIS